MCTCDGQMCQRAGGASFAGARRMYAFFPRSQCLARSDPAADRRAADVRAPDRRRVANRIEPAGVECAQHRRAREYWSVQARAPGRKAGRTCHARLVPTQAGNGALQLRHHARALLWSRQGGGGEHGNGQQRRGPGNKRNAEAQLQPSDRRCSGLGAPAAISPVLPSRDHAFLEHGEWRLQHPPNESTSPNSMGRASSHAPFQIRAMTAPAVRALSLAPQLTPDALGS